MADEKNIARARRGAAWLDRHLGKGWRRWIRRRKIAMGQGYMEPGSGAVGAVDCGCILAQIDLQLTGDGRGDYQRAAVALGIVNDRTLVAHGFVDAHDSPGYGDLTEAWREVLREPTES